MSDPVPQCPGGAPLRGDTPRDRLGPPDPELLSKKCFTQKPRNAPLALGNTAEARDGAVGQHYRYTRVQAFPLWDPPQRRQRPSKLLGKCIGVNGAENRPKSEKDGKIQEKYKHPSQRGKTGIVVKGDSAPTWSAGCFADTDPGGRAGAPGS